MEIYLKLNTLYISECKVYSDALDVELPGMLEGLLTGQRYDMQGVSVQEAKGATEEQRERLGQVVEWLAGIRE